MGGVFNRRCGLGSTVDFRSFNSVGHFKLRWIAGLPPKVDMQGAAIVGGLSQTCPRPVRVDMQGAAIVGGLSWSCGPVGDKPPRLAVQFSVTCLLLHGLLGLPKRPALVVSVCGLLGCAIINQTYSVALLLQALIWRCVKTCSAVLTLGPVLTRN